MCIHSAGDFACVFALERLCRPLTYSVSRWVSAWDEKKKAAAQAAQIRPRLEVVEPEFNSEENRASVWTQSGLVGRKYPTVQMQGSGSGVTFYLPSEKK